MINKQINLSRDMELPYLERISVKLTFTANYVIVYIYIYICMCVCKVAICRCRRSSVYKINCKVYSVQCSHLCNVFHGDTASVDWCGVKKTIAHGV